MMLCPKCGKENLPTSKFCQHCGAPLAPPPPPKSSGLCPKCGTENPPTGKFCQECGASLAPPPPPPPPKPPVCPKCGKENLPTSKFCQECGTPLVPAAPPPQSGSERKQHPGPERAAVIDEKQKARLRRLTKISNIAGISLAVVAGIIFFYFVIGPGSGQKNVTPVPPTTSSKTTPPVTSSATTTSKTIQSTTTTGKTLSDMLGLSSNIVSIKYDMLVSGPGIPAMTMKTWVKKNRMRTEMTQQGTNVVMLIDNDAKTMYTYMPDQNLAMKIPFDQNQVPASPADQAKTITSSNARVTSTETYDGKVCTVVEYTSGQQYYKAWVWQDKGIVIRLEATISGTGKIISEYKNIDFSDIPDSMFQLPAGVKIM